MFRSFRSIFFLSSNLFLIKKSQQFTQSASNFVSYFSSSSATTLWKRKSKNPNNDEKYSGAPEWWNEIGFFCYRRSTLYKVSDSKICLLYKYWKHKNWELIVASCTQKCTRKKFNCGKRQFSFLNARSSDFHITGKAKKTKQNNICQTYQINIEYLITTDRRY